MNKANIYPNLIKRGAKFGFFTPSDPILPRRIEFVKKGLKILIDWGYDIEEISDKKLNEWAILRNSDVRVKEFHEKLKSSEFGAIMATWGGKNASDLLQYLNYELIKEQKKPIIGSSDVAVILNAITTKTGLITFYGPNVLGKMNQTEEIGFPFLTANSNGNNVFPDKCLNNIKIINSGECEGTLFGGSLGTFTLGLSGTEYIPQNDDIIFFFESSSLDYYRIRQHLTNLRNTGFLEKIKGVIVGVNSQINEDNESIFKELLIDIFNENIPIIWNDSFGHGFYYNHTLLIGCPISLNTNKKEFKYGHIK